MSENILEVNSGKMEELEALLIDATILQLGSGHLELAEISFNMLLRLLEAKAMLVRAYSEM